MKINYVDEIERSLRRINRILNKDLKREMMRLDLSLSHFYVITTLYREGEISSGKLAKALDVSNATVTSLVDKLVKLSYVERKRGDEDRRVVLVSLTEKGKEITKKLISLRKKRLKEIAKEISEDRIEEIYKSLKRIKEILDEHDKNK